MKTNLILIGMPGAGKSTIGVILAKRLGMHFLDTDLIIQAQKKRRLQQIIDSQGLDDFRLIEEQMLLDLTTDHCVIATGGSVVYCHKGLQALCSTGQCVYLQVSQAELQQRIADMGQRGLVMGKEQNFEQLFIERSPLYEKFADLTVNCSDLSAEQIAAIIETKVIQQRWFPKFGQCLKVGSPTLTKEKHP